MDKIESPYQVMLERLRVLDQSIYILNMVNNDFREILRKQKPLPQFVHESFKRSTINKSKPTPALPPPKPPTETEEMRLAASIIDKAKRAIENVGEKKPKQSSTVAAPVPTSIQSSNTHNNRPKTSSSIRPSSSNSTILPSSNVPPPTSSSSSSSQPQPVRRYVPAHMKAPFQTQPEKKRRPSSSNRNNIQTNTNQKPSTARRSLSQQRRQSSSSAAQSIIELPPQATPVPTPTPTVFPVQNEANPMMDNESTNGIDHTSAVTTVEEPIHVSNEVDDMEILPVTQPIILNRALIKPLRRLWKQNQNLRLRLARELEKKSSSSPSFINRLNEQIHSPPMTDEIHVPNIEVLLQLAIKLRAIVLYLLENSTFEDLDGAFKRLTTLKYLVNRYQHFFAANANILVTNHHHRPTNINTNVAEWLSKPVLNRTIPVRYTDDGQLIAFTEVRFKKFENECRWIELNWHEKLIVQFKQTLSNKNQNPLQIYRELMSLVTGLQTSTPIVVENRLE